MSINLTSLTGDWKTDIKDWTKISEKTATLMLTQGEAVLKETLETAKGTYQKAEKILTVLIPITTALLAYVGSHLSSLREFIPLTALFCLPVLLTSIGFSYYNFVKYEIAIPGEFPKNIVTGAFIDTAFVGDQQYVNMVLSICENVQRRIDVNNQSNKKRTRINIRSIRTLALLILCPMVAYALSLYLGHVLRP